MTKQPNIGTDRKPGGMTWQALAAQLETTDRSLRLWRQRPGAPQAPDLEQWRAFMQAENLGRTHTGELADLRRQVEAERLRKLKRENQVAEGRLLPKETLGQALTAKAAIFVSILRRVIEREMPAAVVGLPIAEIRVECIRRVDSLIVEYNRTYVADQLAAEASAGTGQPVTRPEGK